MQSISTGTTFTLRLKFAAHYALRHLFISTAIALFSAAIVFGMLYPAPYRNMLGVGAVFLLVLAVDVVCGPLLTLVLASPKKSQRERWLDFFLIGIVQLLALIYGLHTVWLGRPVVLAFEVDRLIVVTASEIEASEMANAPEGFRHLPWWGVIKVGTRRAANSTELLQSIEWGLAGISVATQPSWWMPWDQAHVAMASSAKPLTDLLKRRPSDAASLQAAASASGIPLADLYYLPMTSRKTLDWITIMDRNMSMVGYAPVDGFEDTPAER